MRGCEPSEHNNTSDLTPSCYYPKQGAASRPLVSALTGIARRRPVLLLEEVLLPLLCQDGAGVGSAQCEVVTRLVKQGALPPERLDALLLGLCQDRQAAGPALPPGCSCEWTDLTLPVLTAILLVTAPYLPPLGDATVLALLERLEGAVAVRFCLDTTIPSCLQQLAKSNPIAHSQYTTTTGGRPPGGLAQTGGAGERARGEALAAAPALPPAGPTDHRPLRGRAAARGGDGLDDGLWRPTAPAAGGRLVGHGADCRGADKGAGGRRPGRVNV